MTINELLDKPVWQMTGEELLFLAQHGNISTSRELTKASSSKEEMRYVYGLAGIARLFGCSLPTANRIKQSGKINRANSSARSASTIILRPTCVMARLILPLCLIRLAVGKLHPKRRAMPAKP